MTEQERCIDRLRQRGYNVELQIDDTEWAALKQDMSRTRIDLLTMFYDGFAFRDDRPVDSLHCKVFDDRPGEHSAVVELEQFNPRFYPLLHLLVDVPRWCWRTAVGGKDKG